MSNSLRPYGPYSPWNSPGQITFPSLGDLPNPGIEPRSSTLQVDSLPAEPWGKPIPTIPLMGLYPEKTTIQKDTYTPQFTAALFTIARAWKQPRCPSGDERIRKLWYIYIMEYYSVIKKNAFESVLMRWMKRAYYTEWSKTERKTPIRYIDAYIWNFERWGHQILKVKSDILFQTAHFNFFLMGCFFLTSWEL